MQKVCLREREKMRYTGGNKDDVTAWGPLGASLGPGSSLIFCLFHSACIPLHQLILFYLINLMSQRLEEC